MNYSSERASPGGSSALSRHCTSRCVLVNVPSFSTGGGGHQEDLGLDVLGAQLARLDLGRVAARSVADSSSTRSRTTSHFMLASARRCRPACIEPTAGFWPITKKPSSAAVERPQHRREVRVVAGDLRQVGEAVVVLRGRGVAEPRLQQRDDVLVEVRPPAACRRRRLSSSRRA